MHPFGSGISGADNSAQTARKSRRCRLFIAVDINRSKPFFVWHFSRLSTAAMYIPRGGMLDQISGGRILK
jgi:hypothetical protein